MNLSTISHMIDVECQPLNDEGTFALLDTAHAFADGDLVSLFVELLGSTLRFFDDGDTILHFLGRGVSIDNHAQALFIRTLTEPHEVVLTARGELEICGNINDALSIYEKYLSAIFALVRWEHEQEACAADELAV